jgi:hypothetical protein
MPPLSEYKQQDHPDPLETAMEQLDVAIELFLSERSFVSALTLAGAAEGVLTNALKNKGKETALESEFAQIDASEQEFPFFHIYPRAESEKERRRAFNEFKRRGVNFAKHGPGREPKHKAYQRVRPPGVEGLAEEAIERACDNAARLDLKPSEALLRYDAWLRERMGR